VTHLLTQWLSASGRKKGRGRKWSSLKENLAGWTGLEPATSDVTGRRSNQLNYHPAVVETARAGNRGELVGGTGFEPVALGV
jgi:hypothetical protein